MKVAVLLLSAPCCLIRADDSALIRPNGTDFTVAVRLTRDRPALSGPLGVNLIRSTNDADVIDQHWDVAPADIALSASGGSTQLAFTLPLAGSLYDKRGSYVVAIPFIPSTGRATRAEIRISTGLTPRILSDVSAAGFCSGGVILALAGDNVPEQEWRNIDSFFGQREADPDTDLHLQIGSAGSYDAMLIRTLVRQTRSLAPVLRGAMYSVCINTVHELPKGSFNGILDFGGTAPAPLKLLSPVKMADLNGGQMPSMNDASAPPGRVGERSLERNLDLGLAYTQSRDRKTGEISRLGVLDLRLAPLLDIKKRIGSEFLSQQTIPSWYWFLTPLYIDANVSTGSITGNTVSLNRISIGPQLEFRYMKLRSSPGDATSTAGLIPLARFPNVHRFILSANNYSDRDFKQLEYVAKFEYQPLLGIWNRPRNTRWKFVKDPVTGSAVALASTGWRIDPKLGTEIGNTYRRRNPAEAVQPSDFVRRGYAGLDVTLEITDYFAFTASDTLYLRGEISPTHLENYLKLEADFPVGSPLRETSQSFFLTYERGSLPPFEDLSTNALRLGYRIRSENWFGFRR